MCAHPGRHSLGVGSGEETTGRAGEMRRRPDGHASGNPPALIGLHRFPHLAQENTGGFLYAMVYHPTLFVDRIVPL